MNPIILLVDDSLMIHRVIGQILTSAGYKVLKAYDGKKGVEMAKTWKPDLILMDIEMPKMTGIEATKLIKAEATISHIPLVIFTSLGAEEDIRLAKEAGADGFLNKPVSRDELLNTIEKLINR